MDMVHWDDLTIDDAQRGGFDNRLSSSRKAGKLAEERELVVSCPRCLTFEILWVRDGKMEAARRFTQRKGRVYHDCGSKKPCLLFPATWWRKT